MPSKRADSLRRALYHKGEAPASAQEETQRQKIAEVCKTAYLALGKLGLSIEASSDAFKGFARELEALAEAAEAAEPYDTETYGVNPLLATTQDLELDIRSSYEETSLISNVNVAEIEARIAARIRNSTESTLAQQMSELILGESRDGPRGLGSQIRQSTTLYQTVTGRVSLAALQETNPPRRRSHVVPEYGLPLHMRREPVLPRTQPAMNVFDIPVRIDPDMGPDTAILTYGARDTEVTLSLHRDRILRAIATAADFFSIPIEYSDEEDSDDD